MRFTTLAAIAAALACATTVPAMAQDGQHRIVSLYRAPPGHQVELLKWLEGQERVAAAAGVPKAELYVHESGDSWDYLLIQPATTDQQDAAMEAAGKKLGIDAGPGSSIEFRKHIAVHTDTMTRGPTTIADYLRYIGAK